MKTYLKNLDLQGILLEDDETEYGGVAFVGETLYDFLDSFCDSEVPDTVEEINEWLVEFGIKPILI